MAGRVVQFDSFTTTYHDIHSSPSSSPEPGIPASPEQTPASRPHTTQGAALSPPGSVVEMAGFALEVHYDYPGASAGSTSSSISPEPYASPHFSMTQSGSPAPPFPIVVRDPSLDIHKYLRCSQTPSINFDLLYSYKSAIQGSRSLTPSVLAEAASIPHASSITVFCSEYKTITLKSGKGNPFVTVRDVLRKLYHELREGITKQEYESLPPGAQLMLRNASESRCQILPADQQDEVRRKGIKIIDYLNMKTRFLGFFSINEDGAENLWVLEVAPRQQDSSIAAGPASDISQ